MNSLTIVYYNLTVTLKRLFSFFSNCNVMYYIEYIGRVYFSFFNHSLYIRNLIILAIMYNSLKYVKKLFQNCFCSIHDFNFLFGQFIQPYDCHIILGTKAAPYTNGWLFFRILYIHMLHRNVNWNQHHTGKYFWNVVLNRRMIYPGGNWNFWFLNFELLFIPGYENRSEFVQWVNLIVCINKKYI